VILNTATSEELQQVLGIGTTTADKILKMCKSHDPVKSVDDLLAIQGLGRWQPDKMGKYLTFGITLKLQAPVVALKDASLPNR
jgi:competence ComEA-like helix-hairpin-helix protein